MEVVGAKDGSVMKAGWVVVDTNTCRIWDCPDMDYDAVIRFRDELRLQGFMAEAEHLLVFDDTLNLA